MKQLVFPSPGGRLCIGGVEIAIHAPENVSLHMENPHYHNFIFTSEKSSHADRLRIDLVCADPPGIKNATKIFDTIDAWTLYRDESDFWLQSPLAADMKPYWIARFKPGATRAELYCPDVAGNPRRKGSIRLPFAYPLDQLLLMYYLAARGGALVHAAGMIEKGKAWLFAGISGAGKSTFSELLRAAGSNRLLSDERVIVREIGNELVAFGTPWPGTSAIAANDHAPLAGIFLLTHGITNRISLLDAVAAADRMLPMLSIPWYDPETAAGVIASIRRVVAVTPVYEFGFSPKAAAIEHLRAFIRESD